MKKIHYDEIVFKDSKIFYNNSLFTGEIFCKYENGHTKTEFEVSDGFKNGFYNEYDNDGNLKIQKQYLNNLKHGFEVFLKSNGQKIKNSTFKNGIHINSIHYDNFGKEIKGLKWFDGIISNNNLKIRKYYITNRYIFNPRLLWLNNVSSSIISHFLNYLYSNSNYEMSVGGGGIRTLELTQNNNFQYDPLMFTNKKSKKHLDNLIVNFKKNFPMDYEKIFYDTTIDDITELSKYKMLIYGWTFSSSVNKNTSHNDLFNQKYLKISEGYNTEMKKWIVMDYSVKPIGIVFESDEKKKCLSWINQWNY